MHWIGIADSLAPSYRITAIIGMAIFGTISTISLKFASELTSPGCDSTPHPFEKPWFTTGFMFLFETLSLLIYIISNGCHLSSPNHLLVRIGPPSTDSTQNMIPTYSNMQKFLWSLFSTICDLITTCVSNYALSLTEASIWHILRGSTIVATIFFVAKFFHRQHYRFMTFSASIVIIGLLMVGGASLGLASKSEGEITISAFRPILWILGAQLFNAGYFVICDHILHSMFQSPSYLVGIQGLCGTVIVWGIFIPIVSVIPKSAGKGLHEDILDTFEMLKDNKLIVISCVCYGIASIGWTLLALRLTNSTDAITTAIFSQFRSVCIWVVQLVIRPAIEGTDFGREHPHLGENLSNWSILEAFGFLVMIVGQLIYGRVFEIPCFEYPPVVVSRSQVEEIVKSVVGKGPITENWETEKKI
jgi:drug/metabolite transporter (DMT)-like permease